MNSVLVFLLAGWLAGCAASEADRAGPAAADTSRAVRTVVATDGAPAAIGPYSQAVQVGSVLYLSGQIGIDPASGQLVQGGIEAETRRVMENLRAVLSEAGYGLPDVVRATVFLVDLADYGAMNEVYGSYFPERPPARAAVQVARLPRDARVEIMMTAAK